jgi:hypothetical protein
MKKGQCERSNSHLTPTVFSVFELPRAELSAASTVYPQATAICSPGLSLNAGRTADLAGQDNVVGIAAVRDRAIVATAIVRGAGKRPAATSTPVTAITTTVASSGDEFGAASAIDPYAPVVIAPALTLIAGGTADLTAESHSPLCIDIAVVTFSIIGGAGNGLATAPVISSTPAIATATTVGDEFGAASAIDPDPTVIPAPGLALNAGGSAPLLRHLNPATRISAAVIAMAIIGGAVDGLSVCSRWLHEGCTTEQEKEDE